MPDADAGLILPSSSQDKVFILPSAVEVVRQEKAGLVYLQECENSKHVGRRLCVGDGTVKRNCTLQLM